MIINHFNSFPYGGAANAALNLHRQLRAIGTESRFWYSMDDRGHEAISSGQRDESINRIQWRMPSSPIAPWKKLSARRRVRKIHRFYDRHLAPRNPNLEVFSMPALISESSLPASLYRDIVHLHWIAFMADYESFFHSVPDSVPIVWTLHDMNPLTGGCHYSGGCERFASGCGNCPQVVEPGPADASRYGSRIKRQALRRKNLFVVSPSRWLLELARQSPVLRQAKRFEHIRLGFDLETLYPVNKSAARRQLGISTGKVVVGFGAESIDNRRKGLDLLLSALASLRESCDVECLVVGAGESPGKELELPPIHSLGYINDPQQIRLFYSACDLVVVPSREDNQPQMGLEAMACGTPVVAFNAGGIGEYVRPGETGLLAEAESAADLAGKIRRMSTDARLRARCAGGCREMIEQEFDIRRQARLYQSLYEQALDQVGQRAA